MSVRGAAPIALLAVLAAGCDTPPAPPAPPTSLFSAAPPPAASVSTTPAGSGAPIAEPPVARSPDGKHVLLLRPQREDPFRRDLVLARADGSSSEVLVVDDPSATIDDDKPRTGFFNVAFDPRGGRAFFSVSYSRGEAICAVDLATKTIQLVNTAFGAEHVLIPSGPHKGDLLLYHHRYEKDFSGTYDVCILTNGLTGEDIRDVTDIDPECLASPAMKAALGF